MKESRTARAEALLAEEGLRVTVSAAGLEGEIAAVRADPAALSIVRRRAADIRELGFRSVALELGSTESRRKHGVP